MRSTISLQFSGSVASARTFTAASRPLSFFCLAGVLGFASALDALRFLAVFFVVFFVAMMLAPFFYSA